MNPPESLHRESHRDASAASSTPSPVGTPHAHFRVIRNESDTPAFRGLAAAVQHVFAAEAGHQFVLLRESPLDQGVIDQGDVDLLGDRESVDALLKALLPLAVAGEIHFRVTATKPEKVQLTLYSVDFAHQAVFDLWMRLPQIAQGRYFLSIQDLRGATAPITPSVSRMPACLEAAVYLHHLASKGKSLDEPHTRQRIETFLQHSCGVLGCRVPRWFREVVDARHVGQAVLQESQSFLEDKLDLRFDDGRHFHPRSTRRRLPSPRAICVCGVDGVGKTTLINAAARSGLVGGILTGKRLYRTSWIYQLMTRRARRIDPHAREKFDERHCRIVHLRAALVLRLKLALRAALRRGSLLIDRSLSDFLFLGRKTEDGHFDPLAEQLARLAPRMPTVHLVAPHDVVERRKAEVTEAGHWRYDTAMLLHQSRQPVCDHFVFHNGGSPPSSCEAFSQYLEQVLKVRRKAAAAREPRHSAPMQGRAAG